MKNILHLFIVLLSFSAIAQQEQKPDNFVVLTTKTEQLKPILLAAEEFQSNGGFRIVLYGGNVAELLNPETKTDIEQAEKLNVKLSVCRMSLDRLKIDPLKIPAEVEIVDNAFLYAFQLQKKGYQTLNL